jgi:C_GCAxxG_C_C family probable redox protein
MPDSIEDAVQRFESGLNCAQAVLSALAPRLHVTEETALRVAALFGGGMGRQGEVCGAVTGALMALGLRHGTTVAGDAEGKDRNSRIAAELMARFRERHGSLRCLDLLGCDLGTPEGRLAAQERGLFKTVCPALVCDGAAMALALME